MPAAARLRRPYPARRRAMRAAVALTTAAILGTVAVSTAAAAPPPTPTGYSATDTAAEIAAITQLKADYFHYIDTKNWDALRELLAPNVVEDTTGSGGPYLVGRDPFIAFLKLTLGGADTHHQGFDPQIRITSGTTAEGVWRLEDILVFGGAVGVHGYGRYDDRYAKVDGRWVVTYSKLTRTGLDLIDPEDGTVTESNVSPERVDEKVRQATGR